MNELRGGRGQASGFVMRMMAENKLKHKGRYKNPSAPLDPNSTMKAPVAFDYRKLANGAQRGTNKSAYGASPFIKRHFSGAPVAYKSRAQRLAQGDVDAEVPEETDEQKEARLRATAAQMLEKARELAGLRETKGKAATKIQSLRKIRKSMKFGKGLKAEKAEKGKAAAEAERMEAMIAKGREIRAREEASRVSSAKRATDFHKANPEGFFSDKWGTYFKNRAELAEREKEWKEETAAARRRARGLGPHYGPPL